MVVASCPCSPEARITKRIAARFIGTRCDWQKHEAFATYDL